MIIKVCVVKKWHPGRILSGGKEGVMYYNNKQQQGRKTIGLNTHL